MAVAIATAAAADAQCSVSVLENLGQACASSFPSESHLFSDIRDQRLGMALVGRGGGDADRYSRAFLEITDWREADFLHCFGKT